MSLSREKYRGRLDIYEKNISWMAAATIQLHQTGKKNIGRNVLKVMWQENDSLWYWLYWSLQMWTKKALNSINILWFPQRLEWFIFFLYLLLYFFSLLPPLSSNHLPPSHYLIHIIYVLPPSWFSNLTDDVSGSGPFSLLSLRVIRWKHAGQHFVISRPIPTNAGGGRRWRSHRFVFIYVSDIHPFII